jgi:hypothetical protein
MTAKKAAHGVGELPPLPTTFEPESYYMVRLSKDVKFGGVPLHANQVIKMKGSAAQELRDGLASADLVTV